MIRRLLRMRAKPRSIAGKSAALAIALLATALIAAAAHAQKPAQAISAKASARAADNPHILFTQKRPPNAQDEARGREILATLRNALAKYQDYKAAEAAGYKGYYLNVAMPVYHFASSWRAFKELLRFDPAQPTALLYRKTGDKLKLIGVMYYAPEHYSADDLNARIPLSLVRWHREINVCLPPDGAEASKDPRFGSDGAITTRAACVAAGGTFRSSLHGWMAEVYPFAKTPAKIWAYRPA